MLGLKTQKVKGIYSLTQENVNGFFITYIIYLLFYVDDYWYIKPPDEVCKIQITQNPFGIVLYFSLVILMIIVTTTIIIDIIDGFYIVYIIKKILNINTRDYKVLSSKLTEVVLG